MSAAARRTHLEQFDASVKEQPINPPSANMAQLIRQTLANPYTEQPIREQMIALAARHLHEPDVLAALVAALPQAQNAETRRHLLTILFRVDPSRFASLESFHTALLDALKQERERGIRAMLLERLATAVQQDERIVPVLLDTLAQPATSDEEMTPVMMAISRLPSISVQTATLVLRRARSASTAIQELALAAAEGCTRWDETLLTELRPYLDTKVDRTLRLRIMRRLAAAGSLTIDLLPALSAILRQDPDAEARSAALDALRYLKNWDENALLQVIWTATYDGNASLRSRAVQLLQDAPDLSDEQLAALAQQLGHDDASGTRTQILGALRGRLGQPGLRTAVVASYAAGPSAFDRPELECLLDLLAPYASRDDALRQTLLQSLPRLRVAAHRQLLLEKLLANVRPDSMVESLVAALAAERQPQVRRVLFDRLKPLTVLKHPALTRAYCAELADPGSPFRLQCARTLLGAIDVSSEVLATFEDVLLYERDRLLVRTCLDAYLRPSLPRRFEVLLAVIANEALDLVSRQEALEHVTLSALSPDERSRLDGLLAAQPERALRLPT
jgi:hypothetical protein